MSVEEKIVTINERRIVVDGIEFYYDADNLAWVMLGHKIERPFPRYGDWPRATQEYTPCAIETRPDTGPRVTKVGGSGDGN